jgi:hypothetical protein
MFVQEALSGLNTFDGVPMASQLSIVQSLVSTGMSDASIAVTVLPTPSQTITLQSPVVCPIESGVPDTAYEMPHLLLEHVYVLHSSLVPQLASFVQPVH